MNSCLSAKEVCIDTQSPESPYKAWRYFSSRLILQLSIQEILLSPSFPPSHPTKMFSSTGELRIMHKSKLQMIIWRVVAVLRLSDIQKSRVARLWPCFWWFEEVLMKEQDVSEKNIIIWLAWYFIWLYQPFFLLSLNNGPEGQVMSINNTFLRISSYWTMWEKGLGG